MCLGDEDGSKAMGDAQQVGLFSVQTVRNTKIVFLNMLFLLYHIMSMVFDFNIVVNVVPHSNTFNQ